MTAASERATGPAKVIPIETAPSWTPNDEDGGGAGAFASMLAGAVGDALAGHLGPVAESVFGKGWEGRAANGLAFLRRRITGDYEVDEFGFDRELTDEVFLPLLRGFNWFRSRSAASRTCPNPGAPCLAQPRRCAALRRTDDLGGRPRSHPTNRDLRWPPTSMTAGARAGGAHGHTVACTSDAHRLLAAELPLPRVQASASTSATLLQRLFVGRVADRARPSCRARSSAPRRSIR